MNISPLTIYLWQLADRLIQTTAEFSLLFGTLTCGALITFCATRLEDMEDELKSGASKLLVGSSVAFLLAVAANTFTPSSKTMAMMVIVPEIAKSKVLQQDVPDIYNAAVEALKAAITPKAAK